MINTQTRGTEVIIPQEFTQPKLHVFEPMDGTFDASPVLEMVKRKIDEINTMDHMFENHAKNAEIFYTRHKAHMDILRSNLIGKKFTYAVLPSGNICTGACIDLYWHTGVNEVMIKAISPYEHEFQLSMSEVKWIYE